MNYPSDFINKIICGDCLEVMKDIPDNSIDLVVTDPPYNKESLKYYKIISKESQRILKKGKFLFVYASNYYFVECLNNLIKSLDFFYLFQVHIQEGCCGLDNVRKLQLNGKTIIALTKDKAKPLNWSFNLIKSKFEKEFHNWQQSLGVTSYIINQYSNQDDLILDPFLGSGTTAVACKKLNRNFIGIEISPEYCAIAEKRLRKVPERLDNILRSKE